MAASIRTCLWFNGRGREAAAFYCALLPGSRVEHTAGGPGFDVIDFTLAGVPYRILDAGPHFTLTEAVSIAVTTPDQAGTDHLWQALTADGGSESMCGWLKDRFGLSWQIVPAGVLDMTLNPDPAIAGRAMAAMMTMRRLDLAAMRAAVAAG